MARTVEGFDQIALMLSAPRAIALVSVPWSPWPRESRRVLTTLESTRQVWLPRTGIEFFELWPERDDKLNQWYDELCRGASATLTLHGHGYGPLWWMVDGSILDCVTKSYELPLVELQQRTKAIFESVSR